MLIPLSKEKFLSIFTKNVYEKIIKESSIREKDLSFSEYKKELGILYELVNSGNYCPNNPREFLMLPKTEYVARTIPLLSYLDESFYYFATKTIEEYIAENRVENTFGGWRLGTKLKEKENDDIELIKYVYNSYNPYLWTQNWKNFLQIAKSFIDSGEFKYVIKFDISNFYDSINLNILFNKLFKAVPKDKAWCLDCLQFFLKYWNRKVDNYLPKSQGLPQTEFGDQSRLLANFYLQDYDQTVKKTCDKYQIKYVRYADDQLLFLKDDDYKDVLLVINSELNNIGLNLNSSKCKMFSIEEFSQYYLFEPLMLIDEKKYDESLIKFVDIYRANTDVRYDTYLKRILGVSIGLDSFKKELIEPVIKEIIFTEKFLLFCNYKQLSATYKFLTDEQKIDYIVLLERLKKKVKFNSVQIVIDRFFNSIDVKSS